jgi:lipopolysaccharide transport system ATP-binding protein
LFCFILRIRSGAWKDTLPTSSRFQLRPIIKVENLGKQYRIGAREAAYATLRESLIAKARAPFSRRNGHAERTIWALRDVSFEVHPGEVVGIIGRNGAGKSTLLKILSRITEPTEGCVDLYGRVGSLLEVGTGFHPELTGRENIFLNGSILGMTHQEIQSRFDEIVAFAEVDQFLDTPVKRYSSGMYVRLAFAVAAHLQPEILVVDEVLAVGDAAFQKKCLGRMKDVATEGRTVLFVSHNMAAVSALCSKAMVLHQGVMQFPLGPVETAVQKYLNQINEITKTDLANRTDRQGAGRIRIVNFGCFDRDGYEVEYLISGQQVDLRIYYESNEARLSNVTTAIGVLSHTGTIVTMLSNQVASEPFDSIARAGWFSCRIKKLPLSPGTYTVNLIIRQNELIEDWIQEAVTLVVEPGDFYGTGRMPPPTHGGVFFEQEWSARGARES